MVEGESAVVIAWGMGKGDSFWNLSHYIYEVREFATQLGIFLFMCLGIKMLELIRLPIGGWVVVFLCWRRHPGYLNGMICCCIVAHLFFNIVRYLSKKRNPRV